MPTQERILTQDDGAPVRVIPPRRPVPLLLVCDHAGRVIPALWSHICDAGTPDHTVWDPGAAFLTRALAHRLGCGAVYGVYSRLICDLNRPPGHEQATAICANHPALRVAYTDQIYTPYHKKISHSLDHLCRRFAAPAIIAIHTFTPRLRGQYRIWQIGALWNRDQRLAQSFSIAIKRQRNVAFGDNQPYSGRRYNHTLDVCAQSRGLPHLSLEIRNDLLRTRTGARFWARIVGNALECALFRANNRDAKKKK